MKYLIPIILILLIAPVAYAQEPTPAPGGGGIDVPQDPLPYTFEPFDYDQDVTPIADLDLFDSPDFVNTLGSTVLTLFTLVDTQNVLPVFVVLLGAMWILWHIYKFTTTSVPDGGFDMSLPSTESDTPEEYEQQRIYYSNPYKVYRQKFVRKK